MCVLNLLFLFSVSYNKVFVFSYSNDGKEKSVANMLYILELFCLDLNSLKICTQTCIPVFFYELVWFITPNGPGVGMLIDSRVIYYTAEGFSPTV